MSDDRNPPSSVVCRPSSFVCRSSTIDHQLSSIDYQPSYYLKIPFPFPICHLGAEFPPFPFPSLGEMLHRGRSTRLLGNRGILHHGRGSFEIGGKAAVLGIPVAIAYRVGHR